MGAAAVHRAVKQPTPQHHAKPGAAVQTSGHARQAPQGNRFSDSGSFPHSSKPPPSSRADKPTATETPGGKRGISPETKEQWRDKFQSLDDIQTWIDGKGPNTPGHFQYDKHRHDDLQDGGQNAANGAGNPKNPETFFKDGETNGKVNGVCVDLAQFGVTAANETLPGHAWLMEVDNTWKNTSKHNDDPNFKHWIGVYLDPTTHTYFGFADSRVNSMHDPFAKPPSWLHTNNGNGYSSPQALYNAYASFFNAFTNPRQVPFTVDPWKDSFLKDHV